MQHHPELTALLLKLTVIALGCSVNINIAWIHPCILSGLMQVLLCQEKPHLADLVFEIGYDKRQRATESL